MNERKLAFGRAGGLGRRAVRLAMVAAVAALVPLALPQPAGAQYSITADSDGYVPVYDVCFAGAEVGYYSWYNDGYTTSGEISIDSCLLDSLGAGPADYDRVLAHEQGHAAGYGHSDDPNSIMYPYTYIYQSTEQYEAPEAEQYEAEQYEAPETEQYAVEDTPEVQQYEPETEGEPDVREVPREEMPPVRVDEEAGEKKEADEKKEAEKRKEDAERDEDVDRIRSEAAALSRVVDGPDALADEETRSRAEALARTLEEGAGGRKKGPLVKAKTRAEEMSVSLNELGEQGDEPAQDRARTMSRTRDQAEDLAGALDRAGADAANEGRTNDLKEAGADVRTVASKLDTARKQIEEQETAKREAAEDTPPPEPRATETEDTKAQDAEPGLFTRIREFFASIFA